MKRLLHPLSYILLCTLYSSLAVALRDPLQLVWVFVLAAVIDCRQGPAAMGKRLSILGKIKWLLLSVIIIQLLFRRGGEVLFSLGFFKIHSAALIYSIQICLRIMVIFLCASSLSKMDFSLYRSAFSRIHLPEELSFMVSYMAHLIPRLSARFKEQKQELRDRGIILQKIGWKKKLEIYRILALSTVADLILKSGRQAMALELRGFRSAGKSSSLHRHDFHLWDLLILLWGVLQFFVLLRIPNLVA